MNLAVNGTNLGRGRRARRREGGSERLADPEHVTVRVADVTLAHTPWFVGRGMGDVEAFIDAALVDVVDVVDPDRHPCALVRGFVAVGAERLLVGAFAAAALSVAAEEDLGAVGFD